jgi:hypothetical protein
MARRAAPLAKGLREGMKRVKITRVDGTRLDFRCQGVAAGADSRNLILRKARLADQMPHEEVDVVGIPLHTVQLWTEDDRG